MRSIKLLVNGWVLSRIICTEEHVSPMFRTLLTADFISYEVHKSLPNYLNDTCMSLSSLFVHVNETRLDAHGLLFSLSLSFSHKNFIRWYGASCQNLYQRQKTGRKNLEINKWTLNVAYWEDREKSAICVSYNGWNIVQLCLRLLSYIELIKNFHRERTSTTLLVSIETNR